MRGCSGSIRIALAVTVLCSLSLGTALAGDSPCEDCGGNGAEHWIHEDPECQQPGMDEVSDQAAIVGVSYTGPPYCDLSFTLTLFPCQPDPSGVLTISRSGARDDSWNPDYVGLRPLDGHLDVIDTEIVQMCLEAMGTTLIAGAGLGNGPFPLAPSYGAIAELPPEGEWAESFFDVFFELETGAGFLYNREALRLEAEINCVPPDGAVYIHPLAICIGLFPTPVAPPDFPVAWLVSAEHLVNPGPSPVEARSWSTIKALYR